MVLDRPTLTAAEIAERTGWEIKPQGACKGHQCVPLPGIDSSGPIDIAAFADAMDMALVADADHGLWALGPRSSGSVLDSATVPDIVLTTSAATPSPSGSCSRSWRWGSLSWPPSGAASPIASGGAGPW